MKKYILLGLLFSIALCIQSQEIEYGKIIDTVWCEKDSGESYSLYLPKNYRADTIWPIIFGLEPAARGSLPTKKYKDLFEKYGYIFLCSNNSRNGSWEVIENAANAMIMDAFKKFSIDKNRVFFTGFSGGSRSSSLLALKNDNIKGVIACGAGFPSDRKPQTGMEFDYIGLVGYKDANYFEMNQMSASMESLNFDHQLTVFNGGHRWPPINVYEEGIIWMEIKAMEKNLKPVDSLLINKFIENQRFALDTVTNIYDEYLVYKKYYNFLKKVEKVTRIKNKIGEIEHSDDFKEYLTLKDEAKRQMLIHFDKVSNEFLAIDMNYLSPIYPKKDLRWWQDYIDELNAIKENGKNQEEKNMAYRVLDLIGNNTYSKYEIKMDKEQYSLALHFMKICNMINIGEKWPVYYIARAYAAMNDQTNTYNTLLELKNMGLKTSNFLYSDPYLNSFMKKKKFRALFEKNN